jgi:hypothetical protein
MSKKLVAIAKSEIQKSERNIIKKLVAIAKSEIQTRGSQEPV